MHSNHQVKSAGALRIRCAGTLEKFSTGILVVLLVVVVVLVVLELPPPSAPPSPPPSPLSVGFSNLVHMKLNYI